MTNMRSANEVYALLIASKSKYKTEDKYSR